MPRYNLRPPRSPTLFLMTPSPPISNSVSEERGPRAAPSVAQGLPTLSMPLLSGGRFFRGGLLPLLVGGWGAPRPSPHSQASPWGLQTLVPPPVLCWNTEEGWQGSSCTSQAGQSARGLDQGWAWGQLGRLASWGNPEAAEVGQGEGMEATGQRGAGWRPLAWTCHPGMAVKSTDCKVRFRSQLICFLDVWPCASDCLSEPR